MNRSQFSDSTLKALWDEAERRLLKKVHCPPASEDDAKWLLEKIPPKRKNETVGDRIQQNDTFQQTQDSSVTPFTIKSTKQRFTLITEIRRLAAATSDDDFPLPDPDRALESIDSRFRLKVRSKGGKIHIVIEALGFATEEYAKRKIALLSHENSDEAVVIVELDQTGEGSCLVDNTQVVRKALLRPLIALAEDE